MSGHRYLSGLPLLHYLSNQEGIDTRLHILEQCYLLCHPNIWYRNHMDYFKQTNKQKVCISGIHQRIYLWITYNQNFQKPHLSHRKNLQLFTWLLILDIFQSAYLEGVNIPHRLSYIPDPEINPFANPARFNLFYFR